MISTRSMPLVGKGAFSKVYRKNAKRVLIKSKDPVKEAMACGFFPESSMFPKVTHVGNSACGNWKYYEEKYYPRVRSLKKKLTPFEWEFYCVLRDINWGVPTRDGIRSIPNKFTARRQALLDAHSGLQNYNPHPRFEISPRNVAVHNSKLILLDCFFIH